MTQRVCFVLALLALFDQMAAPGYLKSWTSTKGIKMLQAITLAQPAVISTLKASLAGNKASQTPNRSCRQPTTDYDRFLIQTGVKCLK